MSSSSSISRTSRPSLDTSYQHRRMDSQDYNCPPSPLSQPPLTPDFGDESPTLSSILTPVEDMSENGRSFSLDRSSHPQLQVLSAASSPLFGSDPYASSGETNLGERGFPFLPSSHASLRQKLYASMDEPKTRRDDVRRISPPHTPKGHHTGFMRPNLDRKLVAVSNPYPKHASKRGFSLPRRYRPVLMLLFCLSLFSLVLLSRATQQARQAKAYSNQQASALKLRQAKLHENRESSRQAYHAKLAETAIQSGRATSISFGNSQEELAALIAFITSTTSNALPALNPEEPIDPALILDFDPSRPGARQDLELLMGEINTIYPLVLFGKMRDPWHREMKKMLAEYKIVPAPLVIDVDQRRDHEVFIPLLARLLGGTELPQLLLRGKKLGSYLELLDIKEKGEFGAVLEDSGFVVRDAKKKKGVKERERLENERILGPAPIVDV